MSGEKPFIPRSDVALADILLAVELLDPAQREHAYTWIPELLGIPLPAAAEPGAPPDPSAQGSPTPHDARRARHNERLRQQLREQRRSRQAAREPSTPPPAPAGLTLPTRLTMVAEDSPRSPRRWLDSAPALAPAKPFRLEDTPELEPLFEPRRSRSLLASALATAQPEGNLDIAEIIDQVTRRVPLTCLPREDAPTTRLGVQLLVDGGPGLVPYTRDQQWLLDDIRKVVGRDRVQVLGFERSPLLGVGNGPRSLWDRVHTPPAAGTPVVVLTDLGIARRHNGRAGAPPSSWLRFARRVGEAGCPLLAIVPYSLARVPLTLQRRIRVLSWSRPTTVSSVRRLIGKGLRA